MSKKIIRKDKTCLNCRYVVENKFCPHCGQENSDTRKTFHHLFIHFFEDLTHYENAFWRTIRNLLFRPAALTKEYLSGKRLSYLAPVRLYIFISFVAFFIFSVMSENKIKDNLLKNSEPENQKNSKVILGKKKSAFSISVKEPVKTENESYYKSDQDSVYEAEIALEINKIKTSKDIPEALKQKLIERINDPKLRKIDKADFNFGYDSVKELDIAKKQDSVSDFEYWFIKKAIGVKENNTKDEIIEKGLESASHNFPKVLLIYMPLFAFFLWLFHNKKRWYYFDHGIFTLHYFSFLLLITLMIFLINKFINLFVDNFFTSGLQDLIKFAGYGWMFYYFFPAHHRFYGETRWVSFFKSIILFFINMILITVILVLFFLYTLINIH